MGANTVRFNVSWGQHEYKPNPDVEGTYLVHPGEPPTNRYYWQWDRDRLDAAVDMARCNGFRVLLTLAASRSNMCDTEYSGGLATRGCGPNERDFHVDPDPNEYRAFVRSAVEHFGRSGRAQYFAIWNEPNHDAWLVQTGARLPYQLYGRLYGAGYAGWHDAGGPATGTKVLIGELAPSFRSEKQTACNFTRGRCPFTALHWLQYSAESARTWLRANAPQTLLNGGATVPTHGFALHPYQHVHLPFGRVDDYDIGISDLYGKPTPKKRVPSVNAWLETLCGQRNSTAPGHCQGILGSPDGGPAPLYLTEFGYYLKPEGRRKAHRVARNWHPEATHGSWYRHTRTVGGHTGAMERAWKARAEMMLLYQIIEAQPGNESHVGQDTGLFASPIRAGSGDDDITGYRNYGRRHMGDRTFFTPERRIKRVAYCKIRRWAMDRFLNATFQRADGVRPFSNSCKVR